MKARVDSIRVSKVTIHVAIQLGSANYAIVKGELGESFVALFQMTTLTKESVCATSVTVVATEIDDDVLTLVLRVFLLESMLCAISGSSIRQRAEGFFQMRLAPKDTITLMIG